MVSCAGTGAGRNVAAATRAMYAGNLIIGRLVLGRFWICDGLPVSYLHDNVSAFRAGSAVATCSLIRRKCPDFYWRGSPAEQCPTDPNCLSRNGGRGKDSYKTMATNAHL